MKVVVLHSTMRKGSTYHVSQLLFEALGTEEALEIENIRLLQAAPSFCTGCYLCFDDGGHRCPHLGKTASIEAKLRAADLIVICSPVYAGGMPAQLKSVFDHLSYSELMHKPHPEMFHKVAVPIFLSAGKGHRRTAEHLRVCLADLGVSHIFPIAQSIAADSWETVTDHRREQLARTVARLTPRVKRALRSPRVGLRTWFFFRLSRLSIKKWGWNKFDVRYWTQYGWLEDQRPWSPAAGSATPKPGLASSRVPFDRLGADDRSAVPTLS